LEAVEAGRFGRAVALFRRAVRTRRDFPEAYNMLGFSLRKRGRYKSAIRSYEKALRLRPDFPEAHEYIAEAYLGLGDLDKAEYHYEILEGLDGELAAELYEKIEDFRSANQAP
jgi:Flp pilus assembly protein TadD